MSGRVIVVGSTNVDLVVRSARLPRPGETTNGGRFEQHDGGKGANQAVAAARLGADVPFIGAVGSDSFGVEARAALVAEGVDVSGLATLDGQATGIALILVDAEGENLIAVASGASQAIEPAFIQAELARLGLSAGDVVLVSNELMPACVGAALQMARAAGARTILNPAPADSFDRSLLAFVDVLTPNRGELLLLAGGTDGSLAAAVDVPELSRSAAGLPVNEAVVVTLGAEGALIVPVGRSPVPVPAPSVAAVDSTGAGDAFNGALAVGLAEGRSLDEAVRRAVAAGSLATTRSGAREGMPTAPELEAALRP